MSQSDNNDLTRNFDPGNQQFLPRAGGATANLALRVCKISQVCDSSLAGHCCTLCAFANLIESLADVWDNKTTALLKCSAADRLTGTIGAVRLWTVSISAQILRAVWSQREKVHLITFDTRSLLQRPTWNPTVFYLTILGNVPKNVRLCTA